MPRHTTILLLLLVVFAFCLTENGVYAFGAGNIPSFAYMEGRAFRHGDIEDVLSELAKKGSGGFALASMIGKGGSKFGGLDIKRVYFGNWLRDYSQAVDIAGLKKLPLQTIINLCMALGFLAHGYATNEFEVTEERLGVYLPTEHIDNPKGYGEGEDARKYNPKLRPPINPAELEIDPRTGMKNYIANESGPWDTSKALIRRTLEQCIHLGRRNRAQPNKVEAYESYRLLGQALHTLEDYPAHSNFCELALVSMGHEAVFTHVGDQVRVQAPNGKHVAPIVTGTFGSSDFIHSLLGEATDHISQASVTDLNKEINNAHSKSQQGGNPAKTLRDLFFAIPGGGGSEMNREMDSVERIRAGPSQGGKRPEDMTPQELHTVLWQVLSFRDSVMKKIEKTIEKIPGLGALLEKISDSISVFVFTTLEPFLKPILATASSGLMAASGEVIDNVDQYEVFNDPRASDPTHSFLSKDHFNLILNEPAGHIAKIIVKHTVNLVVRAWDDTSMNVQHVLSDVLECLFHPDFHDPKSTIQRDMLKYMHDWINDLGGKQHSVLERLSKEDVRAHRNIRLAGEGGAPDSQGTLAYNQGVSVQHSIQAYVNQVPGVAQAQHLYNQVGGGAGDRRDGSGPGASAGALNALNNSPHNYSQQGGPPSPLPLGGQASSYYNTESRPPPPGSYSGFPGAPPPGPHSGYAPPPGQPPSGGPSFPGGPLGGSYAPPPGQPLSGGPSFPGGPPGGSYAPPLGPPPGYGSSGYAPSYASPPPPSFPGGPGGFPGPSFPGSAPGMGFSSGPPQSSYGGGGPPFPGGPAGFPGADPYGGPPGGDPGFPDANAHHHQHHQHHQQHHDHHHRH